MCWKSPTGKRNTDPGPPYWTVISTEGALSPEISIQPNPIHIQPLVRPQSKNSLFSKIVNFLFNIHILIRLTDMTGSLKIQMGQCKYISKETRMMTYFVWMLYFVLMTYLNVDLLCKIIFLTELIREGDLTDNAWNCRQEAWQQFFFSLFSGIHSSSCLPALSIRM